jgi:hypothetical protein
MAIWVSHIFSYYDYECACMQMRGWTLKNECTVAVAVVAGVGVGVSLDLHGTHKSKSHCALFNQQAYMYYDHTE